MPEDPKRGHSWQICTSNPEAMLVCTTNLIAELDKNPDIDVISLGANDGGGFCECDNCTSLDVDRDWWATWSDRLAVFSNKAARIIREKHPETIIKVGAYAMYLRFPVDPDFAPSAVTSPGLSIQACKPSASDPEGMSPLTVKVLVVFLGTVKLTANWAQPEEI